MKFDKIRIFIPVYQLFLSKFTVFVEIINKAVERKNFFSAAFFGYYIRSLNPIWKIAVKIKNEQTNSLLHVLLTAELRTTLETHKIATFDVDTAIFSTHISHTKASNNL